MAYSSSATRRPVVLIVEDEAVVRMDTIEWVEQAGFEAIAAANAEEAIRILEGRGDIRVVFTDVEMPGSMDGLKLARAVRSRWPPIRLVVTSGKGRPSDRELPTDGRFVAKPYRPAKVAQILWKLVA